MTNNGDPLVSGAAHSTLKLTVALAAAWLLLVGPASMVGGAVAVEGLTYAVLLCLLPHLLGAAFVWVFQPAERPLAGLLFKVGLRMVVVLLGAVVVCWHRPDLRGASFVVWLAPCYFVALAVETRLALAHAGGRVRSGAVTGAAVGG